MRRRRHAAKRAASGVCRAKIAAHRRRTGARDEAAAALPPARAAPDNRHASLRAPPLGDGGPSARRVGSVALRRHENAGRARLLPSRDQTWEGTNIDKGTMATACVQIGQNIRRLDCPPQGLNPKSEVGSASGARLSRAAAGDEDESAGYFGTVPACSTRCGSGDPRAGCGAASEFGLKWASRERRPTGSTLRSRANGRVSPFVAPLNAARTAQRAERLQEARK